MQKNLKTIVVQSLLTVIIQNDTDGDFRIDPEELDPMCAALNETTDAMDGVTFNENVFRKAVDQTGGGIAEMMSLIRDMDDPNKSEKIFEFDAPEDEESDIEGNGEETKEADV